ncbi:tyrosine-type recombinase/integrase [Dokdonella sp.]|uniref:tyrosine-type recombinase/integrase n=1 Tax=Dokdonella sp. TaxID=2291710 RepID=UPI003783A1EC
MATIEKRTRDSGTMYRVKIRLRGYPPADATFDRITDAKRWAAETETAIRAGRWFQHVEAKRNTLADLIDRYIAEYLPTAGLRSTAPRIAHLNVWRAELGKLTLAEVTPARIVAARSKLLNTTTKRRRAMTPATANRYIASLRHCLNIGVREFQLIDDNPTRKVRQFTEPRGRVRFLSDAERDALLRECKAHSEALHTVIVLALATGARRGELLGLRWPDVDLQRDRLTFHATKNGERRSVPLAAFAAERVRAFAKVRRLDCDLVFPGNNAHPLVIDKMFNDATARARIEGFRFHDLRHTAASWLAMSGATLAEIAEVLGHKTLAMVKRYAHLTEGHTRGVVERMNQAKLGGGV